ncbi:MAG: SAM-dependent methyltransferase [Bacteroidia bacterium]|nr:SAM-dependent methyltransferase [Bacteroidia bacterium]
MRLYLLPTPLTRLRPYWEYPLLGEVVREVRYFFVERLSRIRPWLEGVGLRSDAILFEWDARQGDWSWEAYEKVFRERETAALLSEAGLPGVADPGGSVVRRAHAEGYEVIPLAGPSSITLALAASGLSGQQFTFWGYPPRERRDRRRFLQSIFRRAAESTQIVMESPARNTALLQEILEEAPPSLLLCIAHHLTSPSGFVKTYPISQLRPFILPKAPTLFLLGK